MNKKKSNRKKIRLQAEGRQKPGGILVEPQSHYAEGCVRFSLRDANIKRFCIRCLDKQEILRLYKTLGHFEKMTWKQLDELPPEKGLTKEKDGSESRGLLGVQFRHFNKFAHLRVDGTDNPFRVFVGRTNKLLYLLWFDRKGIVHH